MQEYQNYKSECSEEISSLKAECDLTKNKIINEEQKYAKIIQGYEEKISEQLSTKGVEFENFEADWKRKEKVYSDKIETLEEELE